MADIPGRLPPTLVTASSGASAEGRSADPARALEEHPQDVRLTGRVVDQRGEVVAGHEVWLLSEVGGRSAEPGTRALLPRDGVSLQGSVFSTADGRFAFDSVPPGPWWLGPAPSPSVAALGVGLELIPEERSRELELRVWRELWIEGTVRTPEDDPRSEPTGKPRQRVSVQVRARSVEFEGTITVRCAEDGSFRAGPLVPGDYLLTPRPSRGPHTSGEPVLARAGDSGIELRLAPGCTLSGSVVDTNGHPLDAVLEIRRQAESTSAATAEADRRKLLGPRGHFEATGLPPGHYTVIARAQDPRTHAHHIGVQHNVAVTGETRGLRLVAAPSARLDIGFRGGPSEAQIELFGTHGLLADEVLLRGELRVIDVVPGALRVDLRAPDGEQASRSLTLDAGRVGSLVFEL